MTAASTSDLDRVRLRVAAGADPGDTDALPERTAAVLRVATEVGAPLLDALDGAAAADEDGRRRDRAIRVAASQGTTVANGMAIAPLVLVPLLSRLFGVDLLAYHRTPVGMVTGVVGVTLVALGAVLARAVVGRVRRPPRPTSPAGRRVATVVAAVTAAVVVHPVAAALVLVAAAWRSRPVPAPVDPTVSDAVELAAVAVGGGLAPAAALRVAASEVPSLAAPLRRLALDLDLGHAPGSLPPGVDRLAEILVTADHVGAPVGTTLRRLAADVRADELARVLAAAERLPVQLTLPTALLLLPGVLLLVGAPIVADGLQHLTA